MKYHIIAIEREFASGGQEIGTLTAQRLGIPCYGREILQMAAEEMGNSVGTLESLEEKATGSFLYSMYVMANLTKGEGSTREGTLFLKESEIIQRVTQTPCIVVGRCAVQSLSDRDDVLRVFVHANADYRIERAVKQYDIPEDSSMDALRKADKRRASYYKLNTGRDWKDNKNYHIVLDSSALGTEKCVDILEACYRK